MNQQTEPSADHRLFASNMHQMFIALISEGFTEKQALVILGQVVAAGFASLDEDDD